MARRHYLNDPRLSRAKLHMGRGEMHIETHERRTHMDDSPSGGGILAGILIGIALLVLFIVGIGWLAAWEKTNGGEVAVVRNGGPFDNNKIRQVIPPSSARTYAGLWSHVHKYPAQQRFYTISSDPEKSDSGDVDVVRTPTSDGVNVGIEGTMYFTLNIGWRRALAVAS